MPTQPPKKTDPKAHETNGLAYWIGSVDATLANLTNMMRDFISSEDKRWSEFRGWRDTVNKRLAQGAEHMSSHDAKLVKMEKDCDDLKDEIREHIKNANIKSSIVEKYVSWPWIRDKILVPVVVWGIILFFVYLATNQISLP